MDTPIEILDFTAPHLSAFVYYENMCVSCWGRTTFKLSTVQYEAWKNGQLAQNVFNHLNEDEREHLISGTHVKCWEGMFN